MGRAVRKEPGIRNLQASFYKWLVYGCQYSIIVENDKGGDGDEDVSNQPIPFKKND